MMISAFGVLLLIPSIIFNNYYIFMIILVFLFMFYLSIGSFNFCSMVSYVSGVDLISWGFIILSIWIVLLMIMSSYNYKYSNKSKEFIFMNFFLLLFLIFSFNSFSMFTFYFFFEASLIPTLFLIFGWGYQPERLTAGFYLIFYTLFASLPLLLSIFYLLGLNGITFYWLINLDLNFYLFICFILAFLIKMPLVMFHFWLPKAHVEAPVSGSMILAGVLLKLGGYGLMRVSLFLYNYMYTYNLYIISLSLFGGIFCGLICCLQLDMKVLVAYSSVCHMAMSIMGIFSMSLWGLQGSFVLMLAHGLCSSALFCLVNIVYDRSGSRSLLINKGFIIFMPSLCLFWFVMCSNNMGSPLSLNLFGELMLIIGLLSWSSLSMFYLMMMSFLACVYSMYLFSFVNHGFLSYFNILSNNCLIREYMLIFYHLFPLNIFSLSFSIFLLVM
uniref:NADH-ubiquinone oxidoreductase chain 4 n=1 Tax=Trachypeplus jacobsoni TaxID=2172479 RepID=A0A343WNS0_9HEMI|nr:NADH dehydrogenase subunit 4 [Trachypeplus jacobsoni]AWD31646.1 NADH dehydrogenase subunit 4 [Trachypeplus jacobsoni]